MTVDWDLCDEADRVVICDLAHWQGTRLAWPAMRTVGIEGVYCKTWHGTGRVQTGDVQLDEAVGAGVAYRRRYLWLRPEQSPDAQAKAAASSQDARVTGPVVVDVEDPALAGMTPRQALTHAERFVEVYSDAAGHRPDVYTGTWYWLQYFADLDSPIMAECNVIVAAYPRLASIVAAYRDAAEQYARAVVEVCGGKAPALPRPWASRGLQPLGWQFDGDRGLYLPGGDGQPGKTDVDVNLFARSRMAETTRDPSPGLAWSPTEPPPALQLVPDEQATVQGVLDMVAGPPPAPSVTQPGTPIAIRRSSSSALRAVRLPDATTTDQPEDETP